MDNAIAALQFIVSEYKRTFLFVFLLFCSFPFIGMTYMWLERMGAISNIYQEEHAYLKTIILNSVEQGITMNRQMQINTQLISDASYYQQRTCINTAKTAQESEFCLRRKEW